MTNEEKKIFENPSQENQYEDVKEFGAALWNWFNYPNPEATKELNDLSVKYGMQNTIGHMMRKFNPTLFVTRGKIHSDKSAFLRQKIMLATAPDGKAYDLAYTMREKIPLVWSKQSRKWFTLEWAEIISMALNAGIDEQDETKEK